MLGRYPVKVGRSAIPSSAFKMISRKLFEMQGGGHWKAQIQVWPYWNILGTVLSRSERVGEGLVDHIGVKEDMIMFDVSTSKTDPTGVLSYAKAIASNPMDPHSDAFLGLAFLFFVAILRATIAFFHMQTCLLLLLFIYRKYWLH